MIRDAGWRHGVGVCFTREFVQNQCPGPGTILPPLCMKRAMLY